MAKKTKKRNDGGPRLSERQLYQPGVDGAGRSLAAVVPAVRAVKAVAAATQPADEELAAEYRYVLTDLKKIAWLALAMLVLLIALALIIV